MNTKEVKTHLTQKTKSLPQLIKESSTYKLIVPEKVEEKIRYLLRKFPSTEWSGVLFYTHQGSFENNDLVITCQDIFPMDLGDATYTEFSMSEDVAAYMADNIELFDSDTGLCHSHHSMSTFFSGTDMSTLQKEGDDTNCFVSLIVNNAGSYSAKITRKVQTKSEVTVKNLGTSYEFFGDGTKDVSKENKETTKVIEKEVIEYFDLEVERHEVQNSLSYLDDRFEEIRKKKSPRTQAAPAKWNDDDRSFFEILHQDNKNEELDLFGNNSKESPRESLVEINTRELNDKLGNWEPNEKKIHEAVVHMITCNLILNPDKIDLKQWVNRHMINMYKKIFGDECVVCALNDSIGAFTEWRDFIVPHILDYFDYGDLPKSLMNGFDFVQSKVADAILEELYEYSIIGRGKNEEENPFINSYIDAFSCYTC